MAYVLLYNVHIPYCSGYFIITVTCFFQAFHEYIQCMELEIDGMYMVLTSKILLLLHLI